MSRHYYNEIDPKAAAWLRGLIAAGAIPEGHVDERSIADVQPGDLAGFIQCHFFAGIGGWPYALQLAGWPEDRPVWTGSCPCQDWSIANQYHNGGRKRFASERHLWPAWFGIIQRSRPDCIFGEQVENAIGEGWLDQVAADLEKEDYALGPCVLPASSVGAPGERKRLLFGAYSRRARRPRRQSVQCISLAAKKAQPISRDSHARAWSAVEGNWSNLLPGDGLSVGVVRSALKGFGNAINPILAAEFIGACDEAIADAERGAVA